MTLATHQAHINQTTFERTLDRIRQTIGGGHGLLVLSCTIIGGASIAAQLLGMAQ
jgi:hypothetical protein